MEKNNKQNAIIRYLKKLNWFGFSIIMLLSMMGAALNKTVDNFEEWMFLVLIFGLPFSLFFLFVGKKP